MTETPDYEWDDLKNASNQDRHGVAFEAAHQFEWATCTEFEDTRFDYGEDRFISIGFIEGRLFTMAFTYRGARVRIISLRRSTSQERKIYHG